MFIDQTSLKTELAKITNRTGFYIQKNSVANKKLANHKSMNLTNKTYVIDSLIALKNLA
jgi:hypothetical protein